MPTHTHTPHLHGPCLGAGGMVPVQLLVILVSWDPTPPPSMVTCTHMAYTNPYTKNNTQSPAFIFLRKKDFTVKTVFSKKFFLYL